MTRLTEQRIAKEWDMARMDEFNASRTYDSTFDRHLYMNHILAFAHRIAALAVQEVERERQGLIAELHYWRTDAEEKSDDIATLTAQLATAKREGAREALGRCAEWMSANSCMTPFSVRGGREDYASFHVKTFRDREYPATPSPEAREVPREVELTVRYIADGGVHTSYAVITPADAKRIVAMGTEVRDA
jgi:hypothetical protein